MPQNLAQHATTETWDAVWSSSNTALATRRLQVERAGQRWQRFRQELERTFGSRKLSCVELGAGEGDFSVLLAELGHQVTLVDFSAQALARARARFQSLGLAAEYAQTDLLEFAQAQAGQFDVSVSLGLAEHFSGPMRRQVIGAHVQVLRPGGLAFVSVPHSQCLPYRLWKTYLQLRGNWPYGYEEPYSAGEIRRLARAEGVATCLTYKTGFAASVDGCLLLPLTGKRLGWGDGPSLANAVSGWALNLIGRAA